MVKTFACAQALTALFGLVPLIASPTLGQSMIRYAPIPVLPVQDAYPDVAPDGHRIVFESNRLSPFFKLFVLDVTNQSLRPLVPGPREDVTPAWSPSGRQIVFVSNAIPGGAGQIWIVNDDGTSAHAISPSNTDDSHPKWSPDGKEIVFCSTRGDGKNDDIYVMKVDGSNVRRLTDNGPTWDTFPSFSPDGSKIVFRRLFRPQVGDTLTTNSEVMVMNADGTGAVNLSHDPWFDGWPSWSPDGRRIAFASNRTDAYRIYVMNADGSDVKEVSHGHEIEQRPRWFPDGKHIIFNREHDGRIDMAVIEVLPL